MSLLEELDKRQNKTIALSEDVVKNFKSGIIWKAIENELEALLINTWRELEVVEDTALHYQLQGRARCLREMILFFEYLEVSIAQDEEVNDVRCE